MKKTEETSSNRRKKPLSNHCAIIGKSGSGSTFQSSSYVARSAADSRRRYGRDPPAATNWSFQWKSYDDLMIIAIRVGGSNFATTQTRGHFTTYVLRIRSNLVTWSIDDVLDHWERSQSFRLYSSRLFVSLCFPSLFYCIRQLGTGQVTTLQ